jgi:hypothetical protein
VLILAGSVSDVTGVEATGDGGVGGAFDDGTSVGEQSHFVRLFPELQQEVGMTDAAMRLKTLAQGVEINWAIMLVNLDGITSA